jgi:hypothetical protein
LRRWGKKMAVVIDEGFFRALGKMDEVKHASNCDIAWFVVRYNDSGGNTHVARVLAQNLGCLNHTSPRGSWRDNPHAPSMARRWRTE